MQREKTDHFQSRCSLPKSIYHNSADIQVSEHYNSELQRKKIAIYEEVQVVFLLFLTMNLRFYF